MKDILVPWEPLREIPKTLYCNIIQDDHEGFRVILKGRLRSAESTIEISFEGIVGYRNVNESYRLASMPPEDSGTLFSIKESSWVEWLCQESGGALLPEKVKHYAIYTPEDFLDVATLCEPIVVRLAE